MMQYSRVRRSSIDSASSELDVKAPPRQIPGLEIKGIPKPSQAAIEQWRKERTTKLSLIGCLLFITMVTCIVIAVIQKKPMLHEYVKYELEHLKCGSEGNSAYYYKRIEPSSKDWLIYLDSSTEVGMDLDGGGLCISESEEEVVSWHAACEQLSEHRPEEMESFDGILSTDVKNELFSSWNTVVVPWCSGFAFTSNMTSNDLTVKGGALVDGALKAIDFSEAERVVLAGSGTGGLQALLRTRTLKETVNNSDAQVFVIADSAFFVNPGDEELWEHLYHHPESDEFLSPACLNQTLKPSRCFWPEVALVFERPEIPMFIIQSWYDVWNIRHLLGVEDCFESHTFAYLPNTCAAQINKAHDLKARMENAMGEVFYGDKSTEVGGVAQPLNPNLGFWLTTCPSHGFLTHDDSYLEDEIWTVHHQPLQTTIKEWMDKENIDGKSYMLADHRNWTETFEGCPERETPTF